MQRQRKMRMRSTLNNFGGDGIGSDHEFRSYSVAVAFGVDTAEPRAEARGGILVRIDELILFLLSTLTRR